MRGIIAIILVGIGAAPTVHAALGDRVSSIASDQKQLAAKTRVTSLPTSTTTSVAAYTVEEMVSDANTVREYVSPEGIVFAVTWRGLSYPDLSVLLGSYYSGYKTTVAMKERSHGQRHARTETNTLIVQSSGHMRDLRGRAYDTNLIPAGVSLDEIK